MRSLRYFIICVCAIFLAGSPAHDTLHIDSTKGNVQPVPIALPDLAGSQVGRDIIEVVSVDLERSGLFRPIPQSSYIEQITAATTTPRYADWRQAAGWSLKAQHPRSIKGPVILKYLFQEGQDRRKRDIGNLEKAPTDLLVEHKVIEADDNTIVRAIALGWSKAVTGARVQIIPVSKT